MIGNSFSKHIFDEIDIVFYLSWFFDTTDEEYESKNVQQLKDVIEICKKRNINLYFFVLIMPQLKVVRNIIKPNIYAKKLY